MLKKMFAGALVVAFAASVGAVSPVDSAWASSEEAEPAVVEMTDELADAMQAYDADDNASIVDVALAAAEAADEESVVPNSQASEAAESLVSIDGADEPEIVDGVEVFTEVDADLSVVHTSSAGQEQFIAVLGSEDAPTEQSYEFDVPAEATFHMNSDGSIDIVAEVTQEVAVPGEDARIQAEVEEILGREVTSYEDLENVTDEQIDALAAIADEETMTVTTTDTIGVIDAPWAVDAEGNALETYYEIEGTEIIQTIVTDEDIAYPVVADPSIQWWVWNAVKCIGGAASLAYFGPAKAATVGAKVYKALNPTKKSYSIQVAFRAWNNLGRSNSQRFYTLVNQAKRFAQNVKSTRNLKKAKNMTISTKAGANAFNLLKFGGYTIGDLYGLNGCVNLAREAF